MKACGIVAEYNPFHNGHLYQISEARKRSRSDVMIVVMSGNFLQRGEPALIDKWTRAEMALKHGADVVLELPVAYSVQPADIFAKGAVGILHAMKCSALSFGSESGNSDQFKLASKLMVDQAGRIDQLFKERAEKGQSYASRMEQAISESLPNFPIDLSLPNNQLGLAYGRENYKLGSPLQLEVIQRKQANYHEKTLQNGGMISSATAIRNQLLSSELDSDAVANFMPVVSMNLLRNQSLSSWVDFWIFLKYQILSSTVEELKQIYQMEEGLENLLKKSIQQSHSFEEFMMRIKHKRMTRTRLQRLCVYILLQIKKTDISGSSTVHATRVLGFSSVGQEYLNQVKKEAPLTLLTKIDKQSKKFWELDIKAGNLYELGNGANLGRQDFGRMPIKNIDISPHH
ncbi:nucleotidyltransferase [Marinilactibacillus sp. Marseille-P9653]|uniref:nucleotidyltransferase n=1 Tax=Marinilactibacillus sp. Marseille-P9653 TaxID=2866583 RepID=UPI001CE49DDD|nr:nucleotidyltransferase [Marinilactibacillus sp. Marseille-P9653]